MRRTCLSVRVIETQQRVWEDLQDAEDVAGQGGHDSHHQDTAGEGHDGGDEHQQSGAAAVHRPGSQQSDPAVHQRGAEHRHHTLQEEPHAGHTDPCTHTPRQRRENCKTHFSVAERGVDQSIQAEALLLC